MVVDVWEPFGQKREFRDALCDRKTPDPERVREDLDRALEENRELKRLLHGGVGSGGAQEGHPPDADPH